MKDTSAKIEQKMLELFSRKNPSEKFLMGCSMHDFSKKLVAEAIKKDSPDISDIELRKKIFLRFYENDFNKTQIDEILRHFSKKP